MKPGSMAEPAIEPDEVAKLYAAAGGVQVELDDVWLGGLWDDQESIGWGDMFLGAIHSAHEGTRPPLVVTIRCPKKCGLARVVISKGRMSGTLAYAERVARFACQRHTFGAKMEEIAAIDDELLAALKGREQLGEGTN